MLEHLETEIRTDPRMEKVYLKIKGWNAKVGCKRGVTITLSGELLEYLMEDIAEMEEFPQRRLEHWRDEIHLR